MLPIDAEFLVLSSESGRSLLADVAQSPDPRPADLARWRKHHPAEVVSAALRLSTAQRRAQSKFSRASQMWLDPTGLEQSTAEPVALHKAVRFASAPLAVDLCCGIGSDALAIATHTPVIAVDLDPGMARRTLWNARIHNVPHPFLALQARAESFTIPPRAFIHIDPDRRARKGSRARSVTDYDPGLEFLLSLPTLAPGGAVKLSPASDFEAHFSSNYFEIEIISLAGEAREATVWFGSLASAHRRATTLPSGTSLTDRDVPLRASLPISPLSTWVFDPDPALSRSGLLPGLAQSLGLSALVPGVTLLTGPSRVESPFLAPYRVLDTSPADEKHLRRYVTDHAVGRLDIKPRGLHITPETLRRRLKPAGPNALTLIIVGSKTTPALALWAERA